MTAIFAGLAPAVLAVVAQAVLRVGGRALGHPALVAMAAGAFVALALFAVPFPLVVAAAAGVGWLLGRLAPQTLTSQGKGGHDADGPAPLISDEALHAERPSMARSLRILGVGLLVWAAPVAAVALLTGTASTLTTQGLFFSGTALVTFGGAYAVLAYVAQQAVATYGWLSPGEMVRGLALAETTPGPLIMVVQFVAFLGAPYVERLRGNHSLSAALTSITAAVVGVIANLALYFAVHTLFATSHPWSWGPLQLELPELASLRPVPLLITAAALVLIFRLRWSVPRTLAVCAGLGLVAALIGLPVS